MSFKEDIFGSFVEILNTVILMSLFSQQYFKSKIKLLTSIAIMSVMIGVLDLMDTPSISIVVYVIIIIGLNITVKRSIFNILFEMIFATAITILIEHVLVMLFYKVQGIESLDFINRCIQLFITFIICVLLGLNRKLQIKVQFFYEKYQEEFYLIAVTLFCFSMIEVFLWKSNNELVFRQSAVISAYTAIWFLLCSFLLKKLIENRRQKENIRLHEQYMETTENLLDGLYSEKHDFNKHLQAIQSLCEYEEEKQAVKEIELYIEALKEKELNRKKTTVSINTGNGVVNALLYSKRKETEKRGIQLFYIPSGIFPQFPCETYEIVQIIGNLLDNAFEYVDELEEEQRIVMLCISEKENKKQIEVRNTYFVEKSGQVSISPNKNSSTKVGERRGYGLQNVKTITFKYHGKFNIFHEENKFIVEVLF
ncbi:sensor histidine kinase [Aminipila sp.]|uniref:sensor histidine kinase n=1 Tax=Aminipila sp. TaxID=2060095 RepID=UPI00289DC50C|nr:GHKL domain-containing protein [Aminipila sp.]